LLAVVEAALSMQGHPAVVVVYLGKIQRRESIQQKAERKPLVDLAGTIKQIALLELGFSEAAVRAQIYTAVGADIMAVGQVPIAQDFRVAVAALDLSELMLFMVLRFKRNEA
jgi:hypothetical protein